MSKATQKNMTREVDKILRQYAGKANKVIQEAVERYGEEVKKRMIQASPYGTRPTTDRRFKDSWVIAIYNNQVYVGNEKTWKYGKANPPAINMMENTQQHKHYRFLSRNWDAIRPEIERKLIQDLKSRL